MVWTSDTPEKKPAKKSSGSGSGSGSSSGAGSSSGGNGSKSAAAGAQPDSGAVATLGNLKAFEPFNGPRAHQSKSNSGASSSGTAGSRPSSLPDYAKLPKSPITGWKAPKPAEKPPTKPGWFLLIGGVILPLVAVIVETMTHTCAKTFFDPLPTPAHVLLFGLIPLSNLMVWIAGRRNLSDLLGLVTLSSGMAMGVAILYSLMFLPLVPISVIAILWFGFGLLSLSPLLAMPAIWKAGKYAIHLSHNHKTYFDGHQLEHIGHMIILCTVVAVELPSTLTRMHIGEAIQAKNPVHELEWLRAWGNQEVMLRACYERSGRATDILGSLYEAKNHTTVEQARQIFYQVTGKPFNSVPLPAALRATRSHQGSPTGSFEDEPAVDDEFDQDPDIAGEAVSGVSRGLTMDESKLTGFVDGNSCIANLFWTVTFGNTSEYDREVRSKILLPPGAVISNAYLIVNGMEREATVMGRSLARSRYRAAVKDKKDPLLVSTAGADTVLLQLYPVAPKSKIGVRLNIVAPMTVPVMDKAQLALPTFEERNFQVDIPTSITLRSKQALSSNAKSLSSKIAAQNIIEGTLTTPDLARFGAVISAARDPKVSSVSGLSMGSILTEKISKTAYPKPERLFVVIDGSNGMAPHYAAVLKELEKQASSMPIHVSLIRDQLIDFPTDLPVMTDSVRRKVFSTIEKTSCAGGQINGPDLERKIQFALQHNNTSVLWLHAAQPIPGTLSKSIEQDVRRLKKPLLYDFAVAAGPNEVLSGLYNCPGLVRVNRGSDVATDLHELFDVWHNTAANAPLGGIEYSMVPRKSNATTTRPSAAIAHGSNAYVATSHVATPHAANSQGANAYVATSHVETPHAATAAANIHAVDVHTTDIHAADIPAAADASLTKLVIFDKILKIQTVHSGHRCRAAHVGVQLSDRYHLVTPFSSAIITEPIPVPVRTPKAVMPDFESLGPGARVPIGFGAKKSGVFLSLPSFSPPMMMSEQRASRKERMFAMRKPTESASESETKYSQQVYEAPKLEGATNGTVGLQAGGGGSGNPMAGYQFSSGGDHFFSGENQFSSAAMQRSSAQGNTGTQTTFEMGKSNAQSAAQMGSNLPMAPPVASFSSDFKTDSVRSSLMGTLVSKGIKTSNANRFDKQLSAKDSLSEIDVLADKNQSANEGLSTNGASGVSSAYDASDAFNDDVAAEETAPADAAQAPPTPHSNGNLLSPVVPESDTYLLFGAGLLMLAFAFNHTRKTKKA